MAQPSKSCRERGAVATVVAALAAGGILLGMLAISIDVGNVMFERRQLQNGADATAMALAQICGKDLDDCNANTNLSALEELNDANAHDQAGHTLEGVGRTDTLNGQCGRVPGVSTALLPVCDSATSTDDPVTAAGDLRQCPALPGWLRTNSAIPYVETYARTQAETGPVLDFFFEEGGATLTACARAAWGTPTNVSVAAPITISACEWERNSADGTKYQPGPQYVPGIPPGGTANPGYTIDTWPDEVLHIKVRSNNGSGDDYGQEECHTSPSGVSDAPGGFGFLSKDGGCTPNVIEGWVRNENGSNLPQPCRAPFESRLGTVIDIPVYDCIARRNNNAPMPPSPPPSSMACDGTDGNGSAVYHLVGFAKFYLSGYNLPSMSDGVPNATTCPGNTTCLRGWFVSGTLSTDSEILPPGGSTDFGVFAIRPAG